jgi:hypothetical protein
MSCDDETTAEETVAPATLCDLDRTNNVWVEGVVDEDGNGGICMLDNMREDQVVYVLQRDEVARADLCRVTSNEHLLELAATVPRLPTGRAGDVLQKGMNRNSESLAFYSVFRGRPPTAR